MLNVMNVMPQRVTKGAHVLEQHDVDVVQDLLKEAAVGAGLDQAHEFVADHATVFQDEEAEDGDDDEVNQVRRCAEDFQGDFGEEGDELVVVLIDVPFDGSDDGLL